MIKKKRNFGRKQKFGQKIKFLSEIKILVENKKLFNIKISVKNRNWSRIKILFETRKFGQNILKADLKVPKWKAEEQVDTGSDNGYVGIFFNIMLEFFYDYD